jgi:transcriptional regulator with XRE-family HTH domain
MLFPMSRDTDASHQLLEEFGRRVRALRDQAGLTQAQLSEASGVHRVTIARVEAGSRELGLTSIAALARALRLTTSQLLDGVVMPEPTDA